MKFYRDQLVNNINWWRTGAVGGVGWSTIKKGSTLGGMWKEELTWQKQEARNTIFPPQSDLRRTILNKKILDEEV